MQGTITRRMEAVLESLHKEFGAICDRQDFLRKLKELKNATPDARPTKLKELFAMFDACGIAYERGKDNAYYEELVESAALPTPREREDKMMYALYTRFQDYPTPQMYMQRLVDRLSAPEDPWGADPLRLRILKQFIKYGNYLADAGFGGRMAIQKYVKEKASLKKITLEDVLAKLDDGVFAPLDTATAEQKDPKGKFGLLKVADDLAGGKFRTNGATKRCLYLFAMVYGMTYYTGAEGQIQVFETDIETNLFGDYYTNNLMRFITETYRGSLDKYELDPSGQGINYKNFAEVIYLYYLCKDRAPEEKIRLSSEMIERVKKTQAGKQPVGLPEGNTLYYRQLIRDNGDPERPRQDVLSLPEAAFEDFLCRHYDCNTLVDGVTMGVLQVRTEQNNAFAEYNAILKDLEQALCGEPIRKACGYGLWFSDAAAVREGLETLCDRRPDMDRARYSQFMELLDAVNRILMSTEQDPTPRVLNVTAADKITRASLLGAFYYCYNAEAEGASPDRSMTFREHYDDFKAEADARLARANYQPLSQRNLFDVLLAFSSYAYANM